MCGSIFVATPNSVTASKGVAYNGSLSSSSVSVGLGRSVCLGGLIHHCMPQLLSESALYGYGCMMG